MLRFAFETLAALGLLVVAWQAWRVREFGPLRTRQFSAVAGLGALLLAIDEGLNLHEWLGGELYERGWHEPAGINHFDDVLLMVIALSALMVAGWFAGEILSYHRFAGLFAVAVAAFAAAVVCDAVADPTKTVSWWTEETLEFGGVCAMLTAFTLRARRLARSTPPVAAVSSLAAAAEAD